MASAIVAFRIVPFENSLVILSGVAPASVGILNERFWPPPEMLFFGHEEWRGDLL
jgi:hypothetical protein